ncbi:MAG: IS200/IS605 family accessory protein TnpB-related protein [Thermostichus sp. DG_1_6_bins_120]
MNNPWYNRRVAILREGQPQGFGSKQLAAITEKRNCQMRDATHKAARFIVNHCLEHSIGAQIGTIVFGWNPRQKDGANIEAKTNQQFVQIPTRRLKERIWQLRQQYGIRFIETEESYTSQASFLDNDVLPKCSKRSDGWKPSGCQEKQELYLTCWGWPINADANRAANILRKVTAMQSH